MIGFIILMIHNYYKGIIKKKLITETDSFLFGSIIELFLEFIILGFIESF